MCKLCNWKIKKTSFTISSFYFPGILWKIPLIFAALLNILHHMLFLIWYSLLIINVHSHICDFVLCLILGLDFYIPVVAEACFEFVSQWFVCKCPGNWWAGIAWSVLHLAMGWAFGASICSVDKIFCDCPGRSWDPPIFLYKGVVIKP